MRLKARLCPHGNRDKMKHQIRKDSATAQFDVIRLLLSIATILQLRLGCVDIKGVYLQSGPIQRKIFVRPSKEITSERGYVWRLTKLSYRISETGRHWSKAFEEWLISLAKFVRTLGISQLFVRRGNRGEIQMIAAKITDNVLMKGNIGTMRTMVAEINDRLTISKVVIDEEIDFNESIISQNKNGNIYFSTQRYMNKIKPIYVDRKRTPLSKQSASTNELSSIARLKVEDLLEAKIILKESKQMPSVITREYHLEARFLQFVHLRRLLSTSRNHKHMDRVEFLPTICLN